MADSSFFEDDLLLYPPLPEYDYNQDDLAALLDEGMNDLNDETFGDLELDTAPVGRDFDFAGSTSRFLGAPPPQQSVANGTTQQAKPLSPWTSLDADPLLSSSVTPAPAPVPASAIAFRTVEEIEEEMRAQAQQERERRQFQQQAPQSGTPNPHGRPLTLEEVEAEMLRNARQQPHPSQQQPFQQQQSHGPFSPFFAGGPPPPGQPFPQQSFGGPPPGFPQPHLHPSQGRNSPHSFQQQQQFPIYPQQPQHGRPGSINGLPRGMLPLSQQQGQSPVPRPMQPPMPMGMLPPGMLQLPGMSLLMGGSGMNPNNVMATLFPPLPSANPPPPPVVSLEQQLAYLTLNQHAQHPSLTGVQLQALLRQAQHQASLVKKGEGEVVEVDSEDIEREKASEALIRSVENRIREHEELESKRKRKAAKIASMAQYNNLMTNSDKDFITRIQVSQLITDDPYGDDFYFHIMAAIRASRQPPLPGGPLGGPGQGGNNNNHRRPTRRDNAMQRMAQNVQRLVDSAKQRNKSGQLNVDGALGKIALRTRSAPRQMLQVSSTTTQATSTAGHALLAGLTSPTTANNAGNGQITTLSHRQILAIVEQIYDAVLDLEQMRRVQPRKPREDEERNEVADKAIADWDAKYAELVAQLWSSLRVMEPLDSCVPHPFIAILSVLKGKRILPRAVRHLSQEQTLTLLTLIVATFETLDTVRDAPILDASVGDSGIEGKQRRVQVELKTEAFLNAFIAPVMGIVGAAPLRMVTGLMGLLLDRNNVSKVVQSKPGIAFLTILLSRAESLNQATPPPEAQDLAQWQQIFTHLFDLLSADLPSLFPSTRTVAALPFGPGYYLSSSVGASGPHINALRPEIDRDDEPVWRFLAAVAVCASPEQQQNLVVGVRDKVLECVRGATKGRIEPEVAALKLRNCNLLLHSLGLDSSQLTVD